MTSESSTDNSPVCEPAGVISIATVRPTSVSEETGERVSSGSAAAPYDRSVYERAGERLLGRWLHELRPAPWLEGDRSSLAAPDGDRTLFRWTAAALAVALYCELRRNAAQEHLHEIVRSSLIRWQLSLQGDGRAVCRKLRKSPLQGAILGHVVQLLGETNEFQTPVLLGDIERCVHWVSRARPQTPWLESATICAIADSAPVVRDASLLKLARRRLAALLDRQDEEGWFPECGGPDIGLLSLTIDSLARLYHQNEWLELKGPLCRAVGFLSHFVQCDGRIGGCYGSCATAFVSPYGLELAVDLSHDASALARICREQFASHSSDCFFGYGDDLCAVLGARFGLAALHARHRLPEALNSSNGRTGRKDFPSAGLSVITTETYHAVVNYKNGGSLHVTWHNGSPDLSDPGVIVCQSHRWRRSSFGDRRSTGYVKKNQVVSRGVLRSAGASREGIRETLRSMVRRMALIGRTRSVPTADHNARWARRYMDRFVREVEFLEDRINVCDKIRCARPCETVVCQSPLPDTGVFLFGAGQDATPERPPIFVDGGRYVRVERTYRLGRLVKAQFSRERLARADIRSHEAC